MTDIKIKPQQRKSLAIRVTPGGVEVLIPHELDPDSKRVQQFIKTGLEKLPQPASPETTLGKAEISALVETWSATLGVTVNRVQFQPMRQKWGSISTAGNLTLADDLINLPPHLVEYVVCHELLHLKVPRHNRMYYLLLSRHIPSWQEREQELAGWVVMRGSMS